MRHSLCENQTKARYVRAMTIAIKVVSILTTVLGIVVEITKPASKSCGRKSRRTVG
jgi:hypothetical protein